MESLKWYSHQTTSNITTSSKVEKKHCFCHDTDTSRVIYSWKLYYFMLVLVALGKSHWHKKSKLKWMAYTLSSTWCRCPSACRKKTASNPGTPLQASKLSLTVFPCICLFKHFTELCYLKRERSGGRSIVCQAWQLLRLIFPQALLGSYSLCCWCSLIKKLGEA